MSVRDRLMTPAEAREKLGWDIPPGQFVGEIDGRKCVGTVDDFKCSGMQTKLMSARGACSVVSSMLDAGQVSPEYKLILGDVCRLLEAEVMELRRKLTL